MHAKKLFLAAMLSSQIVFAGERCTGDELTFTFNNIELKQAFAILADFSGNKIEMDQSIAWSGPMKFGCTPWRKVAQDLADRHKLKLVIKDGKMYISK